jgi:hypothetical protein
MRTAKNIFFYAEKLFWFMNIERKLSGLEPRRVNELQIVRLQKTIFTRVWLTIIPARMYGWKGRPKNRKSSACAAESMERRSVPSKRFIVTLDVRMEP